MTEAAGIETTRDADARERALDATRSFLVQAPAGSGKTELLVQRFLALLARVERPERIVAITFTRKAAGEMRERIVAALRDATSAKPPPSPHAARTRSLAQAALEQDARLGWQLLAHPARLAVWTIDALCAAFAQRAPLATRLGAAPRYEENAEALYLAAARDALDGAAADDPHWRSLLDTLDNDAGRAVRLLAGLLARRDQWLRFVDGGDTEALRTALERTLALEIEGELAQIAAAFPSSCSSALASFERYAASVFSSAIDTEALAEALERCAGAGGLPPPTLAALDDWRALAGWLLVANGAAFRATVAQRDGFPPRGSGAGNEERKRRKEGMTSLLAELAAVPGLAAALDAARRLPPPRYDDETWARACSLLALLPGLAARLLLVFRDARAVDFAHGTMAALDALGTEEAPSEFLLALDLRIEHLLIDEFQDTSFTQLELIGRLTAGWQYGDGRTLFAVGDPMQSIYRFREAEVRIFVDAQRAGRVGAVPVEALGLSQNFRAQAALVDWVNRRFPAILGQRSDPWRGTVAFAEATVVLPALAGPPATLDLGRNAREEAAAAVARIGAAQAESSGSIAILVRARAHLAAVLPALRDAGIAFTAIDVDALSERQAVLDLVSLTHALVQPADRLAWLAVLRAPWCGLALPDLFAIVAAAGASESDSVAATLSAPDKLAGLSDDGRTRLERLARCLRPALAARGRATLSARVRGAWLALGGPATVPEAIDLAAAERYFALVDRHERAGDIADWAAFVAALDVLRAEPDAVPEGSVQVMTLHRAKGLEFDVVIIPGLARETSASEESLLRWRRRPHGLLLAPARARSGQRVPLFDYLRFVGAAEEEAELARLLYVGCTRAKRRLHLVAALDALETEGDSPKWDPPPAGSSLARMWSSLADMVEAPRASAVASVRAIPAAPPLRRLPADWAPPSPADGIASPMAIDRTVDALPFDWAHATARHVGVVAHRWLLAIARDGLARWDAARIEAASAPIRAALAYEGVDEADLDAAKAQVQAVLRSAIADGRGRWLLSGDRAEAASEWALAGSDGGAIAHVVLDRTFVESGVRWIVDFKTGFHEGGDVEAFLDREVLRYRAQLERYARIVAALERRQIRLALYYPRLGGWREWAYSRPSE
jgi:ATP-dependent helicase/nuclease subunit A